MPRVKVGQILQFQWVDTQTGRTLAYIESFEDGNMSLVIPPNKDDLKQVGKYRVDEIYFDFHTPIRNPDDGHFTGGTTYGYCAGLSIVA